MLLAHTKDMEHENSTILKYSSHSVTHLTETNYHQHRYTNRIQTKLSPQLSNALHLTLKSGKTSKM